MAGPMSSGSGLDLDLHTTKVTPIFESNEFDGESILHQLGGGSSATMINLPLHQGMLMDDNSSQALLSQSTPHGAHQDVNSLVSQIVANTGMTSLCEPQHVDQADQHRTVTFSSIISEPVTTQSDLAAVTDGDDTPNEESLHPGSQQVDEQPAIPQLDLIWCEECGCSTCGECLEHPAMIVPDKAIPSYARLTLPSFFAITNAEGQLVPTITTRKTLQKRTRFGPLKGTLIKSTETNIAHNLKVFSADGSWQYLDVTDETVSNWLMFMREAESLSEQNVVIYQHNSSLYFSVIKMIKPKQELRYGFADSYAKLMSCRTLKQIATLPPPTPKSVIIKDGFPCDTCDEVFADFNDLDAHVCSHEVKESSSKRKNKRKGRPQKIQSESKAAVQNSAVKLSKTKQLLHCENCEEKFPTKRKLLLHMYIHTGDLPYKCMEIACRKSFDTKFKMDRHKLSHASRQHTCMHCDKSFNRKDHLQQHLVLHDENRVQYKCDRCTKEYNTKLAYKAHTAIHSALEGSLECLCCKKLFESTDVLLLHIKKHTGARTAHSLKKHLCALCDKKFFTNKDMLRHFVTHTKERNFECEFCQQRFGRRDHLIRHLKKNHQEGSSSRTTRRQRKRNDTASADLTRSIQQMLAESNLDAPPQVIGAQTETEGESHSAVQITPIMASSDREQLISVPVFPGTSSQAKVITLNAFINGSASSQADTSLSGKHINVQPMSGWQPVLLNDSSAQRFFMTTDGRLPGTTTLLLSDSSGAYTLEGLQASDLQGESTTSEYADAMKVLGNFTPTSQQHFSQSETELSSLYIQPHYNQANLTYR